VLSRNDSQPESRGRAGCARIDRRRRLRKAWRRNPVDGNEIVTPGHPLAPGQIYDINRSRSPPSCPTTAASPSATRPPSTHSRIYPLLVDECLEQDVVVFSAAAQSANAI
jgi:molybdopterin biosynthesis enzyme